MKDRTASPLDRIDDYVRGMGSEEEAEAFEDDLFARALERTAPELLAYQRLVATLHDLAERGTIESFVTAAHAEQMRQRYGERLAYIELTDAPRQTVVVPRAAEIVLSRLPIVVGDAVRLDLEVLVDGKHIKTMPDVAFERGHDAIYTCCEGTLARQVVGLSVTTRFFAHGKDGRRLIGESLVHTELSG